MENNQSTFERYLLMISGMFVKEAGRKFLELAFGWVLQTGKKTTTGIIRALAGSAEKTFSSYHRFFNTESWYPRCFWKRNAKVVLTLCDQVVLAGVDDTTFQKVGREIAGTGWFPEKKSIYHKNKTYVWGTNWVVIGVVIPYPFGIDKVFCLPIHARLYRPQDECEENGIEFRTRLELLAEMLEDFADWFPKRQFIVAADSQYGGKPALKDLPDNVTVIVRGKRNYTYFNLPPETREPGRRGPDRKKGEQLDKPHEMADSDTGWEEIEVNFYGEEKTLLVKTRVCLWYHVFKEDPIRLVIVKDPQKDSWTSFICTYPEMQAGGIIERYCWRWSIEVMFRDGKGHGGLEDPQCRTDRAVRRQTPFNLGMMSLVQVWYLKEGRSKYDLREEKWETEGKTFSFQKILRCLRWEVRRFQIIEKWGIDPTSEEKTEITADQIDDLIDKWSRVG